MDHEITESSWSPEKGRPFVETAGRSLYLLCERVKPLSSADAAVRLCVVHFVFIFFSSFLFFPSLFFPLVSSCFRLSRAQTPSLTALATEMTILGGFSLAPCVRSGVPVHLVNARLSEAEATAMVVNGFIEPITRELPMEYAVELNRLIEMEMEGSVG